MAVAVVVVVVAVAVAVVVVAVAVSVVAVAVAVAVAVWCGVVWLVWCVCEDDVRATSPTSVFLDVVNKNGNGEITVPELRGQVAAAGIEVAREA